MSLDATYFSVLCVVKESSSLRRHFHVIVQYSHNNVMLQICCLPDSWTFGCTVGGRKNCDLFDVNFNAWRHVLCSVTVIGYFWSRQSGRVMCDEDVSFH